ncbi:hypothetical protein Q6348_05475 [Isoptericola sp. b441]|uniref:Spore coat protein U domain-containing protein n=1 Tax=Actinotalea lenta TaxID=3064654 RepID=A0ABT9D7W4_9CELL|nr:MULTISPECIES: hypothetical protein [unclassified Isoptericola]MDO8106645.1 hypothetical protein [Isoptericola sp. b441]MDO8121647.1 hypothetical protein [Isoptericola sp. b490]
MTARLRPSRRVVALALAALAVAGMQAGSASQLSVDGGTIQAGAGQVVDCQPPSRTIAVSLDSTFSGDTYRTSAVRLDDVSPACVGLDYRLQLLDTTGTPLDANGPAAGTDPAGRIGTGQVVVPVSDAADQPIPTAAIGSVALVITG